MAKHSTGSTPPVRRPTSVDDLYEGNRLHPDFVTDKKVYAWFQKRHQKILPLIDDEGYYRHDGHEWKVPYGVRIALKTYLTWSQMANRYPFYVTWQGKSGKRFKKFFMSMPHAIQFVATKAQYVDPQACVASRHGYEVPPKLRGKFPLKRGSHTYYWCPCCMDARRFYRVGDDEFYAMKKFWSEEKKRYVWADRKLALMRCSFCGITNREPKFRHSNQPFELRKIKKGARRIKRRK